MPKRPSKFNTISGRARAFVEQLKQRSYPQDMISASLLSKKLGVKNKKDKKAINNIVFRMRKEGLISKLAESERVRLEKEGLKKGQKERRKFWKKDPKTPEEIINHFRGVAKEVCKYVLSNRTYFDNVAPEDVSGIIFKALSGKVSNLTKASVKEAVSHLRDLKVLPEIPDDVRARLQSIIGRKGAEALYGQQNIIIDKVRACVNELRTRGYKEDKITSNLVFGRLRSIKGLTLGQVQQALYKMRNKTELKEISPETRENTYRQAIPKQLETLQTRAVSSASQYMLRVKALKVRSFIIEVLSLGFSPKTITLDNVFNELKDKIVGLNRVDVSRAIIWLRDRNYLPKLSEKEKADFFAKRAMKIAAVKRKKYTLGADTEVTKLEVVVPNRIVPEKVIDTRKKFLEWKIKTGASKVVIDILRQQKTPLEDVGNKDLFFSILHNLILDVNSRSIVDIERTNSFDINLIDVAVVARKVGVMLSELSNQSPELYARINVALRETTLFKQIDILTRKFENFCKGKGENVKRYFEYRLVRLGVKIK